MEHDYPEISVILRVSSGGAALQDTLEMLAGQSLPARLFVFCLQPTEILRSILASFAEHTYTISKETCENWAFLNRAMEMTESEVVVFLDERCIPVDENWLQHVAGPCLARQAGASFSRKLPAADAGPLIMNDLHRIFDTQGALQSVNGRHYFTHDAMACSRTVWERYRFQEERFGSWSAFAWSWHIRRRGIPVHYAKQARVIYDEPYSLRSRYQALKREGEAEANIFSWDPSEITLRSYFLRPCFQQVCEDLSVAAKQRKPGAWFYAPFLRFISYRGKYRGFKRAYAKRS